jgi:hypothetical protein
MIVISSREFRANQKLYFEKADAGAEILIHRGKNKTYRLVPLDDNDTDLNKETMKSKIEMSLQQIKKGQYTNIESKEDLNNFLSEL